MTIHTFRLETASGRVVVDRQIDLTEGSDGRFVAAEPIILTPKLDRMNYVHLFIDDVHVPFLQPLCIGPHDVLKITDVVLPK